MLDSGLNEAERRVQPAFIKSLILQEFLLALCILAFAGWTKAHRPPLDLSPARARLNYVPIKARCPVAVRCAAWEVRSDDRRVAGLSGLAIDHLSLLAVSDSGLLVRLDLPGTPRPRADLRALPVVPGKPRSKLGRDSEALAPDPAGGWWVAFEQRHALLRYDADFTRLLDRRPVSDPSFRPNRGVEAVVVGPEGRLHWFAEASGISDSALLPDGRIARLMRGAGPMGFAARVEGLGAPVALPLGRFDNAEGIAAAPRPDGGTRLWIVTDNDGSRWRRTKLVAVDLPPPTAR